MRCKNGYEKGVKDAKAESLIQLWDKCIEKQEFLVGYDNKYKGYVSVEDLDNIISEMLIKRNNLKGGTL